MKTFTDTFLKSTLFVLVVSALGMGWVSSDKSTNGETDLETKKLQGKYANVNGLNMYYESHGAGRPLILLHGGMTTIDTSFGQILPALGGHHDQMIRDGGNR